MTNRTFGIRTVDEPDIELGVFEEPIDRLFPRRPNVVSRRGHRALKIVVRVHGIKVIPPEATAVTINADVFVYGPDRIGNNRHIFRHRLLWGTETVTLEIEDPDEVDHEFEVIVRRGVDDDHLGEGPYEATVKVTPQGEGLSDLKSPPADDFDPDPKVTIGFIAM